MLLFLNSESIADKKTDISLFFSTYNFYLCSHSTFLNNEDTYMQRQRPVFIPLDWQFSHRQVCAEIQQQLSIPNFRKPRVAHSLRWHTGARIHSRRAEEEKVGYQQLLHRQRQSGSIQLSHTTRAGSRRLAPH